MKAFYFLSLIALLAAALPAQAQIIRRPLVYQVVHSPFVNQLVNFGIQQVLPGFPTIPIPQDNSAILVDRAVRGNSDRAAANLRDADDIMKKLLDKHKDLIARKNEPKKEQEPASPLEKETKTNSEGLTISDLFKGWEKATDKNLKGQFLKKLLEELEKAGKADTDAKLFQSHLDKGHARLLGENFPEAITAFRDALKIKPGDVEAKNGLFLAASEQRAVDLTRSIQALVQEIGKVDVKIVPALVQVLKVGKSEITITLERPTPVDLTVTASGKNLTGSGQIQRNTKGGTVSITTTGVVDTFDITIDIAGTSATRPTSATLTAKAK